MPLLKGSSPKTVSTNIREFHTGKTYAHTLAKFGKEKANKQAIAVALSSARRSRKADGGSIPEIQQQRQIEKYKIKQIKPPPGDDEMELDPESDYPIPSSPRQDWIGDEILNGPQFSYGVRGPYADGGTVDDVDRLPIQTYETPLGLGDEFESSWQPPKPSVYWKATHGIDTAAPPQPPPPDVPPPTAKDTSMSGQEAATAGTAMTSTPPFLDAAFRAATGMDYQQAITAKNRLLGTGGEERIHTLPERMFVDPAVNLVNTAREYNDNPTLMLSDPKAIEQSFDLASSMANGIRTAAALKPGIVPEGAAGLFVGRLSPAKLNAAEAMRDAGSSEGEIWRKTGVAWDKFTGAPFRELSDRGVNIRPELLEPNPLNPRQAMIPEGQSVKLGDLYPHEEAYKLYPWARDIDVRGGSPFESEKWGSANIKDNSITLYPNTLENIKDIIRHEFQHLAQFYDGLTPGGSWTDFLSPAEEAEAERLSQLNDRLSRELNDSGIPLQKAVQAVKRFAVLHKQNKLEQMPYDELQLLQVLREGRGDLFDDIGDLVNSSRSYQKAKDKAFENYQSIYGEALARASAERADRPELVNRMVHPEETIENMRDDPVARERLMPSLRAVDQPWAWDPKAYEAFHGEPPPPEYTAAPQASDINFDWGKFEKSVIGPPQEPEVWTPGDIINHFGKLEEWLGRDMTPEEIATRLIDIAKSGYSEAAFAAKKNFPSGLKTKVNKALHAMKKEGSPSTIGAINNLYWKAPEKDITKGLLPEPKVAEPPPLPGDEEYYKAQEEQAMQAQAPAWVPEGHEEEGYSPFEDVFAQPEKKHVPPGVFEKAKILGLNQPGYHATNKGFDRFKLPEDLGAEPELGIHFGTVKAAHDRIGIKPQQEDLPYWLHDKYTPNIIPAIIKADRPLEMPDLGSWGPNRVAAQLRLAFPDKEVDEAMRAGSGVLKMQRLRALIESHGYDSVAYKNKVEDPGSISYITWRPNHVRSFYAKFDPKFKDLATLASSIGGIGVFAMGSGPRGTDEDEPMTKRASGGNTPFHLRGYQESIGAPMAGSEPGVRHFTTPRTGMIHSATPGRTDKLNMNVKGGSYILPASVVSGIGQGNSQAGAQILNHFFKMGPYGAAAEPKDVTPKINFGKPMRPIQTAIRGPLMRMKMPQFAAGGTEAHGNVPIVAAGGEFIIPPHVVLRLGGGDMKHGHRILDSFVKKMRSKTIDDMKNEKPPKR